MPLAKKRVWLLGSGFSKPLGGPLLRDLFRWPEREEDILPFFPADAFPDLARSLPWIQGCFHKGVKEGLWDDAEQFLSYVDDYRTYVPGRRSRLINLIRSYDPIPQSIQKLWFPLPDKNFSDHKKYRNDMPNNFDRRVRRALAAECSRFLLHHDPKVSEAWLPYRKWIASLLPDVDTILSFNYDRVIETAADVSDADKIWIAMPGENRPAGKIAVFKLHGSVDWRLQIGAPDQSRERLDPKPDPNILRSARKTIAIAGPGGSKSQFVQMHLEALWKSAESALKQADQLMIVGYSFPDTDPAAGHRLLEAFASGSGYSAHRWAHIVLGPEVTPSSRRVLSLVASTARMVVVRVVEPPWGKPPKANPTGLHIALHPLSTQDFIGRRASFA